MLDRSSKNNSQQATEPDKNYYTPASAVSLPKGGGAIKGIGEKFTANPVTGTGSMSVPIATSPGRFGFGPQLSLSYDSGAGNSIFGFGWNLSLPSITRKTDKGLPRYWDTEESDVFILSGGEDLVPTRSSFNSPDGQFKIQRYRPRIEGLFARIECWTRANGEMHWRSISKDNVTTLYGKTAESRIADPDNPNRVFSWLICESYDDKGNAIVYEYKSENPERSVGIDITQAHERNRTPRGRAANRYVKHVYYGNQTPRQPNEDLSQRKDWLFEVVFDYGEHDLSDPKPSNPGVWAVRNDPFSSYRAGFEVRTYRLCQRVLMFHHFPDEAEVGQNCLVRSTDFTYSYEAREDTTRDRIYSFLLSVTQTGYKHNSEGGYSQKSLPPLEFTYSEPQIDETVREVDRDSLENLPDGLDGTRYQWVDLDGEGLSGILTEQGNGWFYKRNLSPMNTQGNGGDRIEARFAPLELVASNPASGLANGAQFLDLAGDGRPDLVTLRGATPGFYERTQDEGWKLFTAFKSLPVVDWDNPNLKFIDLDGDGHSDILITEEDCFVWHPSLAEAGFGAAERVRQLWDEEKGPRVVFADATQSIHLADMSGDGLTDIVRIRNGEVCYWPNLGYGRFGAKVTMDHAPWFDAPDIFNQRRIVLADIDGSGTTDILYLSGEGVQVYFNQSGNSWSAKRMLRSFPPIDSVASVTAIDLLGNGTACLVWSSPLPGNKHRVMRYINLMGGQKPHLLIKTVNNMGAETVVKYAPSTKFYLQDRLKGQPWITKLPFPVQVVERVETCDRISGNRFVTRYAYHHGYFDGVEREFRGFGFVEQWDTEEYGVFQQEGSTNALEKSLHLPPVLTKTWFHAGAYFEGKKISQQFEHEYYREPNATDSTFAASLLPDTILPVGLTADEEREAARSLKGQTLRQEIYALDDSEKQPYPYSVSERNYEIKLLQSLGNNRHAVFFTHDRETIEYHYERSFILAPTDPEPDPKKKRKIFDPRVTHAMTLEVDGFGNVLKSVAIAYPRRKPAYPEQAQSFITYTENWVTNKPDEATWYRVGVPIETRTYEITGIPAVFPHSLSTLRNQLVTATEVSYETITAGTTPQKRLIEQVQSLYRPNNQANTLDPIPLPLGEVDSLVLPCEKFKLAFTPGLVEPIYQDKITTAELNTLLVEGQYRQLGDQNWWIPSGRQAFEPRHFYQAIAAKDPFGGVATTTYDRYALLSVQTKDPIGNEIRIKNDYRVMQPKQLIDPNQNHTVVAFDVLGMVAGTAVLGKVDGSGNSESGDSLEGFVTDLSEEQLQDFMQAPRTVAAQLLGQATTRIIYDLDRFRNEGQPVFAATIAREKHVNSPDGTASPVQVSFTYSDGFGREVQKKMQAEPGLAPVRDADGVLKCSQNLVQTDTRWVGTGRTIFNNKGKPVKQYEPFFSPTHLYETEKELVECGVTPILFYDPVGRVVATLHPNRTYEKVVFDPWRQETWDVNDTVTLDPSTDEDVKGFFVDAEGNERLPRSDYLPTWYAQRQDGALGAQEQSAARKAVAHAGTSTIAHLDTLGRTFLTIANNGLDENGVPQLYETRSHFDSEGNTLFILDARQKAVMIYTKVERDPITKEVKKDADGKPRLQSRGYDLLGHSLYSLSMDAGERWTLNNVAGHPIRSWNSRGFQMRYQYDALQRPSHVFVKSADQPTEILVERLVYGEMHSEAIARNLRGTLHQYYDQAGVASQWQLDFKGNVLRSSRQLAREYHQPEDEYWYQVDWSGLRTLTDVAEISRAAQPLLEKVYDTRTTYDALNRPMALTTPDNSVMIPVFNEANLLNQVKVKLRGSQTETLFVKNIDYDAKGQRSLIEYVIGDDNTSNHVIQTTYEYDRETFRLTRLRTIRSTDNTLLQGLSYSYDPVGNIMEIRDESQPTIFHDGQRVEPVSHYTYDALYRLIQATGREHIGQTATNQPSDQAELKPHYDFNDSTRCNLSHPHDLQGMRNYSQTYAYDPVGNILAMLHRATGGDWTRRYDYATDSNRLRTTTIPRDGDVNPTDLKNIATRYHYDQHGSLIQMPHLPLMQWDFKDQFQASSQQVRNGGGTPEITYYVYDASGQRVRKVTEWQADPGETARRKSERIYLGGFEIFRQYNSTGDKVVLERETLHVMDDQQRIALVETKTVDAGDGIHPPTDLLTPILRYQLGNHLGSASLELDRAGAVISYEEYHPYGTTAYQAGRSVAEVSLKRYRYTGKERDEESGLYYHGARYYAPWLGRWMSADPIWIKAGLNLYRYVSNNPLIKTDPTGLSEEQIFHRTTEEAANSMTRSGVRLDVSRGHVWAGGGFYGLNVSGVPSASGARGDVIVSQRISTEHLEDLSVLSRRRVFGGRNIVNALEDSQRGRSIRREIYRQMYDEGNTQARRYGRRPSDEQVNAVFRDYMTRQINQFASDADVIRWRNPNGTYTYVVREGRERALVGLPTIVGRMTSSGLEWNPQSSASGNASNREGVDDIGLLGAALLAAAGRRPPGPPTSTRTGVGVEVPSTAELTRIRVAPPVQNEDAEVDVHGDRDESGVRTDAAEDPRGETTGARRTYRMQWGPIESFGTVIGVGYVMAGAGAAVGAGAGAVATGVAAVGAGAGAVAASVGSLIEGGAAAGIILRWLLPNLAH